MESRLLLDIVIRQGTPILKLLAGKDEALLIRRNTLLVLYLLLDSLDRVRRVNVERDCLARQRFHENLHACFLIMPTKNDSLGFMNPPIDMRYLDTGCKPSTRHPLQHELLFAIVSIETLPCDRPIPLVSRG